MADLLEDRRQDLRGSPTAQPAGIDDQQPAGTLDGTGDPLAVERRQRHRVDHLGIDAGLEQQMLGANAFQRHVADTDDRDVLALAERPKAPIGHLVARLGHHALHVMQHAMFDHDHGIVVPDRRDQAALGVVRRGRSNHAQAGYVHEE